MMFGLDRVPIRLPSSQQHSTAAVDIDARRQLEDAPVASLVEEVLASSPELATNPQLDLPPPRN